MLVAMAKIDRGEVVSVTDANRYASRLLREAAAGKRFVVFKDNRPIAAIVGIDDYTMLPESGPPRGALVAAAGHSSGFHHALGIVDFDTWDPWAAWRLTDREVSIRVPLGIANHVWPPSEWSSPAIKRGEVFWLDCAEALVGGDGHHGAVQGSPEGGVDNLNMVLVLGICARYSPRRMNLVLVDFAGKGLFDGVTGLPHVRRHFHGSDPAEVAREFGEFVRSEIEIRGKRFKERKIKDYISWLKSESYPEFPELLIMVNCPLGADEFADFESLVQAAVWRSLGVHVHLAFTHDRRPKSSEHRMPEWGFRDFMEHAVYRIAFNCETVEESRRMVFTDDAARLPPESGEAIFFSPHSHNGVGSQQWVNFRPFDLSEMQGGGVAALVGKLLSVDP